MRMRFSGSLRRQAPTFARRFIAGTAVHRLSKPIKVGTTVQSEPCDSNPVSAPREVCPDTECIAYDSRKTYKLLVFDLETTGLRRDAEICQLAATGFDADDPLWMKYILPKSYIDPATSAINGLRVAVIGRKRRLLKDGYPVDTVSFEEAMSSVLAFLKAQAATASNTMLVGHNAALFDVPIFLNSLHRYGATADELEEHGIGFADSRRVLEWLQKTGHPSLSVEGKLSLSLSSVHRHLFGEDFQSHDALGDCLALRRVLSASSLNITLEEILAHSSTAVSAWRRYEFYKNRNQLLLTKKGHPPRRPHPYWYRFRRRNYST